MIASVAVTRDIRKSVTVLGNPDLAVLSPINYAEDTESIKAILDAFYNDISKDNGYEALDEANKTLTAAYLYEMKEHEEMIKYNSIEEIQADFDAFVNHALLFQEFKQRVEGIDLMDEYNFVAAADKYIEVCLADLEYKYCRTKQTLMDSYCKAVSDYKGAEKLREIINIDKESNPISTALSALTDSGKVPAEVAAYLQLAAGYLENIANFEKTEKGEYGEALTLNETTAASRNIYVETQKVRVKTEMSNSAKVTAAQDQQGAGKGKIIVSVPWHSKDSIYNFGDKGKIIIETIPDVEVNCKEDYLQIQVSDGKSVSINNKSIAINNRIAEKGFENYFSFDKKVYLSLADGDYTSQEAIPIRDITNIAKFIVTFNDNGDSTIVSQIKKTATEL